MTSNVINCVGGLKTGKEPNYVVHFLVLQQLESVLVKILKIKHFNKSFEQLVFSPCLQKKLIKTVFRPLNRSVQESF